MRHAILGFLVLALTQTLDAQGRSPLDEPLRGEFRVDDPRTRPPCEFGATVEQLARTAHVVAGFQNTPDCWLSGRFPGTYLGSITESLAGMSARQALDHLMTLMPMYSWKEMDGVVVVRPKGSWNDSADVLNFPTKPFQVTGQKLDDALHAVLLEVVPVALYPHQDVPQPERPIDRPVTVAFPGGTLLEALNAVARARQDVQWQLAYSGGGATISMGTLSEDVFGGWVAAPLALPQQARR